MALQGAVILTGLTPSWSRLGCDSTPRQVRFLGITRASSRSGSLLKSTSRWLKRRRFGTLICATSDPILSRGRGTHPDQTGARRRQLDHPPAPAAQRASTRNVGKHRRSHRGCRDTRKHPGVANMPASGLCRADRARHKSELGGAHQGCRYCLKAGGAQKPPNSRSLSAAKAIVVRSSR